MKMNTKNIMEKKVEKRKNTITMTDITKNIIQMKKEKKDPRMRIKKIIKKDTVPMENMLFIKRFDNK